jgi:hypothetical protein
MSGYNICSSTIASLLYVSELLMQESHLWDLTRGLPNRPPAHVS